MDNIEALMKNTVEELDRLLNAKNVLGEPIERENATVIPIVSYGFGFGAGGSEGGKAGTGGGAGAGGGIKPLGAIIIDARGARVEAVQGTISTLAQTLGETVAQSLDRSSQRKNAKKTSD